MASTVTELLRRRFGGKKDTWQEVTLNYVAGDSFVLMGETFTYNQTYGYYESSNPIYPQSIEFTFAMNNAEQTSSNLVIAGGGNAKNNEIWHVKNTDSMSIRFDGQVVRTIMIPLVVGGRMLIDNNKVYYNDEYKADLLGIIKFMYFNGRAGNGGYHPNVYAISKIRVK